MLPEPLPLLLLLEVPLLPLEVPPLLLEVPPLLPPLLLEVPPLLLEVPPLLAPLPDELPLPLLEPAPASSVPLPLLPLLLALPLSPNPSTLVAVAQPAGRTTPTDMNKNARVPFLMASDLEGKDPAPDVWLRAPH